MSIDLWLYDISENHSDFPDNANAMKMRDFSRVMRTKIISNVLDQKTDELIFSKTVDGKPYLENSDGLNFNVSHTGMLWGMAVSRDKADIGFDIERGRERKYRDKMMETYFHPAEFSHYKKLPNKCARIAFFYRLWTQKEAYAKYFGQGLKYNFAEVDFLSNFPVDAKIMSGHVLSDQPEKDEIYLSLACSSPLNSQKIKVFGDTSLRVRITD